MSFLDYFENKWLDKLDRQRRRKQPRNEIDFWNCFFKNKSELL